VGPSKRARYTTTIRDTVSRAAYSTHTTPATIRPANAVLTILVSRRDGSLEHLVRREPVPHHLPDGWCPAPGPLDGPRTDSSDSSGSSGSSELVREPTDRSN
jgi:hypothetical protein